MAKMLGPEEFIRKLGTAIYESSGKKYSIQTFMVQGQPLSEGGPTPSAPVVFVMNNEEQTYVIPVTQAYMEYRNIFDGNFPVYCDDVCKRIAEFDEYLNDGGDIEYDA